MRANPLSIWPSPTAIWLVLVVLTAATYAAGMFPIAGRPLIYGVLVIALLKGYLIAWHYMGMAQAGALWRAILGGWLAVVGLLIAAAFELAGT